MSTTKTKLKTFTTTVTVETDANVEIEPEDLHDAGWYHESECTAGPVVGSLGEAVASLHRQAHPSQHREVALCREEPCRSLSLDQLSQVSGA